MRSAVIVIACGLVAGCASAEPPRADITSPGPTPADVIARDGDGPYLLDFTVSARTFNADDAITGTARLMIQEGHDTTIGAPGRGPIAFALSEVGGSRHAGPAYRMSCASVPLHADEPITALLTKSGGWSADDPDAEFYASFFADEAFRLPAGTWDLTAHAQFGDDADCGGVQHDLDATIRIEVTP